MAAARLLFSLVCEWRAPRSAIRANPIAFDQRLPFHRPGGDRRRQNYLRIVVHRSPSALAGSRRAYSLIVGRSLWRLRSSRPRELGQCTVMAFHHEKPPTLADRLHRDFPPVNCLRLRSNEPQEFVGEEPPVGRVLVCLTRARLHTTKRDWQRTVGQGGGVSAETPARPRLAAIASRTSSVLQVSAQFPRWATLTFAKSSAIVPKSGLTGAAAKAFCGKRLRRQVERRKPPVCGPKIFAK